MIITDTFLRVLSDTTRTRYRIQGSLLQALVDEIHRLRGHLLDVLPENYADHPAERAAVDHLVATMGAERVMSRLGQPAAVADTPDPVPAIEADTTPAPAATTLPDSVAWARHQILAALETRGPMTYRQLLVETALDHDHLLNLLGQMVITSQIHREPGTGVYLVLPSPAG